MKPPKRFGARADPSLGGKSPLDDDALFGRTERISGSNEALSQRLQGRIGSSRSLVRATQKPPSAAGSLQKAVVKVRQVSHAAPTARQTLRAHIRYIGRDGAERAAAEWLLEDNEGATSRAPEQARAQRAGSPLRAYNAISEEIDPLAHSQAWTQQDKRHFRLIVSIERGGALGSLKPMTRAILSEASDQLGKGLDWFAVDHWDTSCPHTHILLRGRSADGAELSLSPRFVRRDLRAIASRIAGEELDGKGHNLWRAELFSEAKRHGPTRLDVLLSAQIDAQGRIAPNNIQGFNADPDLRDALKARAMELVRLGLVHKAREGFVFTPAWRDRLDVLAHDLSKARALHQDLHRRSRLAFAKDAPALTAMGQVLGLSAWRGRPGRGLILQNPL